MGVPDLREVLEGAEEGVNTDLITSLLCLRQSLRSQDQRHDQPVQRQRLPEDQDQDHPHEDFLLLRVRTHARVAHDPDRQSRRLTNQGNTSELNPQHSPDARCA